MMNKAFVFGFLLAYGIAIFFPPQKLFGKKSG